MIPLPTLPMPGDRYTHQSGEATTVIASAWMVDTPDEDAGRFVALLVLLNTEPDYYSTAWLSCEPGSTEWLTDDVSSFPHIALAVEDYARHTL